MRDEQKIESLTRISGILKGLIEHKEYEIQKQKDFDIYFKIQDKYPELQRAVVATA